MEENDKSYYKTMYYTLLSRHKKKNEKYKALKKDFEEISTKLNRIEEEYINNSSTLLRSKIKQLEKENQTYSEVLNTFIKQNKRLFNIHGSKNAEEIAESTTNSLISIRTVILDMEYAFTYQKLLEMHVCDYIIDKLFVLRLLNLVSDNVLNVMFYNTRQFVTRIIQNQAPHQMLNVEVFKLSLRSYVKEQIEMIKRTIPEADCVGLESVNTLS